MKDEKIQHAHSPPRKIDLSIDELTDAVDELTKPGLAVDVEDSVPEEIAEWIMRMCWTTAGLDASRRCGEG